MCFGCLDALVVHSSRLSLDFSCYRPRTETKRVHTMMLILKTKSRVTPNHLGRRIDVVLQLDVHLILSWIGQIRDGFIPWCWFFKDNISSHPNHLGRRIEALVPVLFTWVSHKNAFHRLWVELLLFLVRDMYIQNLSNTLRCDRFGFLPTYILYGVSSCTPFIVHRFIM